MTVGDSDSNAMPWLVALGAWRARAALLFGCCFVSLACGSTYSIRRPTEAREPVSESGLTLNVRFEGDRSESPVPTVDFVPVVVELRNQSQRAVRIRMSDILLTNDRGAHFRPLPIVVGRRLLIAPTPGSGVRMPSSPSGSRFPSQYQLAGTRADATYVIDPRGGAWRPNGVRTYVVDNYRLSSFPADAMDSVTLKEGLLEPGSRAMGYVYFSRRVRRRGGVRLAWDVRTEAGERVAVLAIDGEGVATD